ncbi:N/A [soil metagenome]
MGEMYSFPPGYHSVNPYLVIGNVLEFIRNSELVFNAAVIKLVREEKRLYAEIRIGDTCIMVEENHQGSHVNSLSLWICVKDVVATYESALNAGCVSVQAPAYKYAVDKVAKAVDQCGITWLIAMFNGNI